MTEVRMIFSFPGGPGGNRTATGAGFPAIARVRAYWEGLRAETGQIPLRADLDPRGLAQALDHVFVADRIGTGLLRLRIAGMGLTDLAGLDMKGLPLSCLFLPEARLKLAQSAEQVFTMPAVVEMQLEAERGIGRPGLLARLLLMPLRSGSGSCDLALGCLETSGEMGRSPRRFTVLRSTGTRLTIPPLSPGPTRDPALAEAPAPPPRAPHLRLVHSAD
ncbi:hypothetical protein B6K69_00715 [Fuscovulum blasticum]|nr:hypothetical protein B6K69_00715 [Fuscovulum blasticum]